MRDRLWAYSTPFGREPVDDDERHAASADRDPDLVPVGQG